MRIRGASASRRGLRQQNEDAVYCDVRTGVFAVADGMGGLEHGQRGSALAVQIVEKWSAALHDLATGAGRAQRRREFFDEVESMFGDAASSLCELAAEVDARMGTTLTVGIVSGARLTLGHIGDTRCYRVRGGRVDLLTDDHSVAALRYRRGTMTLDEFYRSNLRNVLYEYLGHDPESTGDVVETGLEPGDALVICTDGVWDHIGRRRLLDIVSSGDPQVAADRFVTEALEAGSGDNCTAVVVYIDDTSDEQAPATTLGRSHLFKELNPGELRLLAPFVTPRSFGPGDVLVEEGSGGDAMFVIGRGVVEVRRKGVPLVQLTPGYHFGEIGFACGSKRSASIVGVKEGDCVVLDREGMNHLIQRKPALSSRVLLRVLSFMGTRLVSMTDRAVEAEAQLARRKR